MKHKGTKAQTDDTVRTSVTIPRSLYARTWLNRTIAGTTVGKIFVRGLVLANEEIETTKKSKRDKTA